MREYVSKVLAVILMAMMCCAQPLPYTAEASSISYVANDTFDFNDGTNPALEGWTLSTTGTSSFGIKSGALYADEVTNACTMIREIPSTTGDKVVIQFTLKIDRPVRLNNGTILSIYDNDGAREVANLGIKVNGNNAGLLITSGVSGGTGTTANDPNNLVIYGGHTYFLKFEIDYGSSVTEQGSFNLTVKDLDKGAAYSFTALKIKGDTATQKYPASLQKMKWTVGAKCTLTLDDLQVYDGTLGFSPEPSLYPRTNIVQGLKANQLTASDATNGAAVNAFDGDVSDSKKWSTAGTADFETLAMDLGTSKTFDSASIYAGSGSQYGLNKFYLEYDVDGSWVPIPGASFDSSDTQFPNHIYLSFAPVTSSKIRLYVNNKGQPRLRQLKIYEHTPYNDAQTQLLKTGNDVTGLIKINNYDTYTPNSQKDVLILSALYDWERLVDIKSKNCTLRGGGLTAHTVEMEGFTLPDANHHVKMFVWDGLDSMQPIGAAPSQN